MIVKSYKSFTGTVTTIETANFSIKVCTAKEGLFKKPSTIILVPDPNGPHHGLKSVGKLTYTPSLKSKARYQIHEIICNILDYSGEYISLHNSIEVLALQLKMRGVITEAINLVDEDHSKHSDRNSFMEKIDYEETCKNIIALHHALNEHANKIGCKAYMKEDTLQAHNMFLDNPCFYTAINLLKADSLSDKLFILKGDTATTSDEWLLVLELAEANGKGGSDE